MVSDQSSNDDAPQPPGAQNALNTGVHRSVGNNYSFLLCDIPNKLNSPYKF